MTNTLVALHRAGLRCRVVLRRLVVTAILALPGMSSQASDSYPDQPVHIVVPYGGGGIADQVPRLLGNQLQRHFGQAFIIESKPGAGGPGKVIAMGETHQGVKQPAPPGGVARSRRLDRTRGRPAAPRAAASPSSRNRARTSWPAAAT